MDKQLKSRPAVTCCEAAWVTGDETARAIVRDSRQKEHRKMVGGTIQAVVNHQASQCILVCDGADSQWRRINYRVIASVGDLIWWQSQTGHLTTADGLYRDEDIGTCIPTDPPARHWNGTEWIELDHRIFEPL